MRWHNLSRCIPSEMQISRDCGQNCQAVVADCFLGFAAPICERAHSPPDDLFLVEMVIS
jgi:hypothetical protein